MYKWETFKNLSLHEKSESRNFHWKTFFVSNLLKFYDFVNNLMIRSKSKGPDFHNFITLAPHTYSEATSKGCRFS